MQLADIGTIEFFTVDGLKIRTLHGGKSAGIPIMLLSPWPESVYAWRNVLPGIAGLGSILAVDLPGYGGSEGRPDVMTPEAQAAFVIKLADHIGVSRMHAIGPDIGTAALLFAARQKPDLFESIVVGGGATSVDAAREILADLINSPPGYFAGTDGGDIVVDLFANNPGRPSQPIPAAVLEDYRVSSAGKRFDQATDYVRAYKQQLPKLKQILKDINTPVLVLAGKNDPVVPPPNGQLLADHLPHHRYVLIEAGHFGWEDAPNDYALTLREWLAGGYRQV